MKTMKLLLKIAGVLMLLAGTACLVAGYMDKLKALCPRKPAMPEEFRDYADVEEID